jgi:hypothetical protein
MANPLTQTPLEFNILSPQNNATYNTGQVPVIYTVNSGVRYAYFVLDGPSKSTQGWNRFEGNMTLTELSEGAHNITLLVRTTDNNMSPGYAKETFFFNVDFDNTPTTLPSVPSPSIPEYSLIILPIIMVAAIFFIVVLRKKILALQGNRDATSHV